MTVVAKGRGSRPDGRRARELRPVEIMPNYLRHAEGSALIAFGGTRVLCAASVQDGVPPFLRNSGRGWVTAEYGMLPRSTHTRSDREATRGKDQNTNGSANHDSRPSQRDAYSLFVRQNFRQ